VPRITRSPQSVDRKKVTAEEWRMVDVVVAAFNDTFATRFKPQGETAKRIVSRLREHPELTAERHRQIIAIAKTDPWWGSGKPDTVGVVYGPAAFTRAMNAEPVRVRQPTHRDTGGFFDD
jgi:hypothetical protein